MRLLCSIVVSALAGLLVITALPGDIQAQMVREHDAQSLRSFHGGPARIRRSFQSDAEARGVLRYILTAAGLAGMEDRIILRASAETPNAEAYIEKDERLIFYNAVFMQELAKQTRDYWSMVAVLAHELGHHIRLHTIIPGRDHEFELEADYQAGFIIRRLGGSLDQAQGAFRTFPEPATPTHPGRSQRLQAVTLGWTDGGATPTPPWQTPPSPQPYVPPAVSKAPAPTTTTAANPTIQAGDRAFDEALRQANVGNLKRALSAYEEALRIYSAMPNLKSAETQRKIADTHERIGALADSDKGKACVHYREAQRIYSSLSDQQRVSQAQFAMQFAGC